MRRAHINAPVHLGACVPTRRFVYIGVVILFVTLGCERRVPAFQPSHVDRTVAHSEYPLAVQPHLVGTYPGRTNSGAGYFYDEVLEYQVWMHPERGAPALAGQEDHFAAFARYETAAEFASKTTDAEAPLVLVRQREHINETEPGKFVWVRTERIAEWNVEWLARSHREPDSIERFLQQHRQAQ